MNCEICGRKIDGKPKLVKVGGAFLYACDECAKKLKKPSLQSRQSLEPINKPITGNKKIERKELLKQMESELKLKPIKDFAKTIKEAREKQGISILQLSMAVGLKESTLKKIEAGKLTPPIESIKKIEKVLKVVLLEEEKEESNTEKILPKSKVANLTLGEILDAYRRKRENESRT
ncbi:MAG: multiprotein bridging factor aMBF1 [Thermoproteota archaeon]|nr:TIGR00270 family protein [Candidatus Brockarchaeota archaeon]